VFTSEYSSTYFTFILKYAAHWEICVCGKINSVYCASKRYKHTYEYAPIELHFRTLWTYFPSIYEMIHGVVTFCLEQYSNSILHTPHSTDLLDKLIGSQAVKKFPAIYATRSFIAPFTRARHLSLYSSNISYSDSLYWHLDIQNTHTNQYPTNPQQIYHKHNI
jgi:hypothetical protein